MLKNMIIFISVLLGYAAINYYIGWHGAFLVSYFLSEKLVNIFWILFILFAFSYLLGRIPMLPNAVRTLLQWFGSYYFALVEFAIILLPLADASVWFLRFTNISEQIYLPIVTLLTILILLALFIWGSWNAWSPVVRRYEVQVDKKAEGLKELRIVMASDLHLGNIVENKHLTRLVEKVHELKPDLVLLPGDLIDDVIDPFMSRNMSEVMKQLRAPFGVFAVLGNHDYYGGHAKQCVEQMGSIGVRVLQDETVLIRDSFYIAGRKDKTAETMDPSGRVPVKELLQELDDTKPIIMMDHQPYHFDKAAAAGVDVLLCGHTHRGQFAPNHLITGRLFELDWGYLLKEKMHVVVSSGFGTWGPPIRLASRCEIIELVVRFR